MIQRIIRVVTPTARRLINRPGQLIATIRLADNNTVHQVVAVSKDGNWPMFVSLRQRNRDGLGPHRQQQGSERQC